MYKICTTCKKHKALWAFHRHKNEKFGVSGQCKECRAVYNLKNKDKIAAYAKDWGEANKEEISARKKIYREENRDKIAKQRRKYYIDNIEKIKERTFLNREKHIKYVKQHYLDNKERYNKSHRKWAEDHPDQIKVYRKNWKRNNRYKVAEDSAKRRAIKRNQTPKSINNNDIKFMYHLCSHMSERLGEAYHVDHIIPLKLNGRHHQDNLQILTARENLQKSDKIDYFYRGVTINDINLCMEIVNNI